MDDKEVFNPQSGERIAPKKPKKFWKDWRFYVYTIIALMLGIVSVSSMVTACAAINAGVGQSESVSSQYKVKHNELITTDSGGYTGYKFQLSCTEWFLSAYSYTTSVYQVDTSNYNLNLIDGRSGDLQANYSAVIGRISAELTEYRPTIQNELRLIKVECQTYLWGTTPYYYTYISFLGFHNTNLVAKPFILLDNHGKQLWSKDRQANTQSQSSSLFILNSGDSNAVLSSTSPTPNGTKWVFQDVESYYKSQGYSDGYADGYDAGETAGYGQGYADGYDAGNTAGSNFTSITLSDPSPRYWLEFFDTDGLEHGGYTQYPLLDFVDNYGNTYSVVAYAYGEFNNPAYFFDVQVLRSVGGSTYILEAHIGSGTVEDPDSNPNVLPTRGVTFNIESARVTMVYNNSLQGNFFSIGWQTTDEFSYGAGYDAGLAVGRSQGANSVQPDSLTNTLVAVFQQPFNQIYRFFNFNILGINVLGIVTGLCSVLIILKVFRKLLK